MTTKSLEPNLEVEVFVIIPVLPHDCIVYADYHRNPRELEPNVKVPTSPFRRLGLVYRGLASVLWHADL